MPSEDTQFKPGHSGGAGRAKGSKNKLSGSFLQALADDFEEYGSAAIVAVRESSPGEYLRVIAGLMPKELLLEVSQEEKTTWVISASPVLSSDDWFKQAKEAQLEEADKKLAVSESLQIQQEQ